MYRLAIVILAAGQGKRMKSALPKVLHPLGGLSLLERVVRTATKLDPDTIHVVYGHGGEQTLQALAHLDVRWVEQAQQLGTGHAVEQAMPGIADDAIVLVLYGDVPLVNPDTLADTVAAAESGGLGLITAVLSDPTGYGRILRDSAGQVTAIIEEKDATPEERTIGEINTGIMAVGAGRLRGWLAALDNENAQGEFYLTDIIARAVGEGVVVRTVNSAVLEEVLGINDRVQLAHLERFFQRREAERLMAAGVSVVDPARFDVRGDVQTGQDVTIDVNVILEDRVVLGDGVRLGPNVVIRDSEIGAGAEIRANSVVEGAVVGEGCQVGPFARLRPGTRLAGGARIGNFVEAKAATIGADSQVNHLSYIGDAGVGRGVNVGAGTVTCNYDGAEKHRTEIEDGAFIGSGSMLVAPVRVGEGATVGAGSTVTGELPAGELTVARSRQTTVKDWKRPKGVG